MAPGSKQDVRQAFARRLREALAEMGIAPTEQKRLQSLFGVSGQAVRKWLDGTAMPTSSRMPQVAAALGVRRAWLQDGEGPMRPTVGVKEPRPGWEAGFALHPEEVKLLTRWRTLNPEQRSAISLLVQSLAKLAD